MADGDRGELQRTNLEDLQESPVLKEAIKSTIYPSDGTRLDPAIENGVEEDSEMLEIIELGAK